jgi:predicted Ser/Thr protein kinase
MKGEKTDIEHRQQRGHNGPVIPLTKIDSTTPGSREPPTPQSELDSIILSQLTRRHQAVTSRRLTEGVKRWAYNDWLHEAILNPRIHLRSAPQLIVDMFDHFGHDTYTDNITGKLISVSRVFDDHFEEGRDAVVGHIIAKRKIENNCRGYAQRLSDEQALVLVGPTATGKSNFERCLVKGLHAYTRTPEGIVPTLAFVLPHDWKKRKGSLGFHEREGAASSPVEEYLRAGETSDYTLVRCLQNDHPLMLLDRWTRLDFLRSVDVYRLLHSPLLTAEQKETQLTREEQYSTDVQRASNRAVRGSLLAQRKKEIFSLLGHIDPDGTHFPRLNVSDALRYGDPCHDCRELTEMLHGVADENDSISVLSKYVMTHNTILRDGQGIALVEHAGTADQQQDVELARRGVVRSKKADPRGHAMLLIVDDIGKYGPDAVWGLVGGNDITTDNTVKIMSMNTQEFQSIAQGRDGEEPTDLQRSIRRRLDRIQVGYLLETTNEKLIYGEQAARISATQKHIEPHTLQLMAEFAVWTRLRKPDINNYTQKALSRNRYHDVNVAEVIRLENRETKKKVEEFFTELSPDRKAQLYNGDATWINPATQKDIHLDILVQIMRQEYPEEELEGMSPSEVRATLLDLSQNEESTIGIYEARTHWKTKARSKENRKDFFGIHREPDGPYGRVIKLLGRLKKRMLNVSRDEFEHAVLGPSAAGVVSTFSRYQNNAVAQLTGKKVESGIPGRGRIDPDLELLREVEDMLGCDGRFRETILDRYACWTVDHPGTDNPPVTELFEREIMQLRTAMMRKEVPMDDLYWPLHSGLGAHPHPESQLLWTTTIGQTPRECSLYVRGDFWSEKDDPALTKAAHIVRKLVEVNGYSSRYAIKIAKNHLMDMGFAKSGPRRR